MKTIEIEDDLYFYIASQTQHIGEGASQILRRLVMPDSLGSAPSTEQNSETTGAGAVIQAVSHEDVFNLIDEAKITETTKMVERFLLILSALSQVHGESFAKVLNITGRNRVYFARDKDTLLETGSSTNPKQIPNSGFWVITNNNTAKKVSILRAVGDMLEYSQADLKRLVELFSA
ncbi:MAG: negative modulator of initiation of replication [Paraglaciecola sp.]|jgi:negative modulator of initiation of replication